MMLYAKYRPATWDDLVGQDKAAMRVRRIIERQDFDRGAFWIEAAGSNNSGIGKTSLAWIIARQLADDFFITELDGSRCDKRAVEDMERASRLSVWNTDKPFRVYRGETEYAKWLFTYLDLQVPGLAGKAKGKAKGGLQLKHKARGARPSDRNSGRTND